MRRISGLAARESFTVTIKHIAGCANEIADSLSRFYMARFKQLAREALPEPDPVPKMLGDLMRGTFIWKDYTSL